MAAFAWAVVWALSGGPGADAADSGSYFEMPPAPSAAVDDGGLPLSTPAVPTADTTDPGWVPRRAGTPEILYVNFDGGLLQSGCGNDAHYDCSTLAHLFDGYVGPFDGNETQRVNILQETRKDLADFGVITVIERPPVETPYTMVMYGDLGPQSFAGIAPYIDCEDGRASDLSFTQGFTSSNTGSTVILQEAAHTWGLEHVDAEFDILNPFKSVGQQSFRDECYKIVANTSLDPTSGTCNQVHQQFCDTGWQNSYREMLMLFGPAVPDVIPPTLEITSPEEGSCHQLPTTIPLLGDVDDDLHPQFYNVTIWDGEDQVFPSPDQGESTLRVTLDLLLNNPAAKPKDDDGLPEPYRLRVRFVDGGGNAVEDSVTFTIFGEDDDLDEIDPDILEKRCGAPDVEVGEDEADEPDPAGTCAVDHGRTGTPWALLGVVLLWWRRRR